MKESSLNKALRQFESTEANLKKLESLWTEIKKAIPEGIAFVGEEPDYENNVRGFYGVLKALPKIDDWKPEITLMDLNEIAMNRFEAHDVGEIGIAVSLEDHIDEPGRLIREYRYRFNQKRRELIRDALIDQIDLVDNDLRILSLDLGENANLGQVISNSQFEELSEHIAQINTLLGSSVPRPSRWSDLQRHLSFGQLGDLHDIISMDWPNVKAGLMANLYGEKEPLPVEVEDLATLVSTKPSGSVATKLAWENLTDENFERLIYVLISSENGYENPEWLTKTNAPDRGRDLSAYRVYNDNLGGTIRHRVIIQCKHWLSKSVSLKEIVESREQMKLWEPPRVDIHVITTSGRFTSDAVDWVDKHNQSDSALRIELWPDSHLERILANRPAIIADFNLR